MMDKTVICLIVQEILLAYEIKSSDLSRPRDITCDGQNSDLSSCPTDIDSLRGIKQ
jgi:hypothetical protein